MSVIDDILNHISIFIKKLLHDGLKFLQSEYAIVFFIILLTVFISRVWNKIKITASLPSGNDILKIINNLIFSDLTMSLFPLMVIYAYSDDENMPQFLKFTYDKAPYVPHRYYSDEHFNNRQYNTRKNIEIY